MSDDFYETIGRILSDSFSNDRDPFDMADKRTATRRTIRRNETENRRTTTGEEPDSGSLRPGKNRADWC